MSVLKKGNKTTRGNDAVASRLADFAGENVVPLAGMSTSQEHDSGAEDTGSRSAMISSLDVDELAISLEGTSLSRDKKSSSGNINYDPNKPKTVSVATPGQKTPKPVQNKKNPLKADLDVAKEFKKCKEDASTRLDLSKSQITVIPNTVRENLDYQCVPGKFELGKVTDLN